MAGSYLPPLILTSPHLTLIITLPSSSLVPRQHTCLACARPSWAVVVILAAKTPPTNGAWHVRVCSTLVTDCQGDEGVPINGKDGPVHILMLDRPELPWVMDQAATPWVRMPAETFCAHAGHNPVSLDVATDLHTIPLLIFSGRRMPKRNEDVNDNDGEGLKTSFTELVVEVLG